MIKHYITKYIENEHTESEQRYAESWIQFNLFNWCFCFSRRKIKI
jgi:hypothetical protein